MKEKVKLQILVFEIYVEFLHAMYIYSVFRFNY